MKTVYIGLLGCGNIGSGVTKLLGEMRAEIRENYHFDPVVKAILVRDLGKQRPEYVDTSLLTSDKDLVLKDPEIRYVVECLGGEHPSADWMCEALRAGKNVVTANKMALALHWRELHDASEAGHASLYYEAAVGGAMPIIKILHDSLQANRIDRITAIINGTTNYLLTRMTDEGLDYQDVLKDAQALGLAEPDPTADVEGEDAMYKLSILGSLAFHCHLPVSLIEREGMTRIAQDDIRNAEELGYRIKLLAHATHTADGMDAYVSPMLVPENHPLASVKGAFNAVFLHGHACGDMMIYGRGAGSAPTAGAMVSDLINAITQNAEDRANQAPARESEAPVPMLSDRVSAFYIRLSAQDTTGVLAQVAAALSEHQIGVKALLQPVERATEGAQITILTHPASEKNVRAAIAAFDKRLVRVMNVLRVEAGVL